MRPCSIYSRSLDRNARELSNLTPHAFEFEGVQCASMEGFLQALKYTDPRDLVKEKIREDSLRELGNRFVRWMGGEIMGRPASVVERVSRGLGL